MSLGPRVGTLVVGLMVVFGCESSPELPTAFEGTPAFSRITLDLLSLSPPLGSELVAGQEIEYKAVAHWELTPEDYEALVTGDRPEISLEIGTSTDDPPFGQEWSGGIDFIEVAADTIGPIGSMQLSGTLTVPKSTQFCLRYDEIFYAATVGSGEFGRGVVGGGADKSGRSEYHLRFPVEGSVGEPGLCVWNYQQDFNRFTFAWGRTFELWVQNIAVDQSVEVFVGGHPAPEELRRWFAESGDPGGAAFLFNVAPGTVSGPVSIRVDGQPVAVGGGLPMVLHVVGEIEDFFDPDNDDWREAVEAYSHPHPRILMFWRGLALTESDRIPDPALNPFGSSDHGVGDWWRLTAPYDLPFCARAHRDPRDELDLILTREDGTVLDTQAFPTSGWVGLAGPVLEQGETYLLWVAPRSIESALGAYVLAVGDCIQFARGKGFPPITEPMPAERGPYE